MLVGKVADGAQEMQPDADSWEKALAVGFEHFQAVPIHPRCAGRRNGTKRRQTRSEMPLCVVLVLRR
jgi:hypothetical protein